MLNFRASIATFLLTVNLFASVSPSIAQSSAQLKPKSQTNGLDKLKRFKSAQGNNYQAFHQFLVNELPSFYNKNLSKALTTTNSTPMGGEILDFGSMDLEAGKFLLVFTNSEPKDTHAAFRQLFKLDPADETSQDYKDQIYAIQLANMMFRRDFMNQAPAESALYDLFVKYGIEYTKRNRDPVVKPQAVNLTSNPTANSAYTKVDTFMANIGNYYNANINNQVGKKNYGVTDELSIVFTSDNLGDRLMGLYQIYGIDKPYQHFGLDMNKLRKDPSQLSEKDRGYYEKLRLVSMLYLYESRDIAIDSKYCGEIMQVFGRECNVPLGTKQEKQPSAPINKPDLPSDLDAEVKAYVENQLDLFAQADVFKDLIERLKDSGYTSLDSRKWLYTVLPYSKVSGSGLSEQQYQQLIDRLVIKADKQIATNKANEKWYDNPKQFVYGGYNNIASIPSGLVDFWSSGYKSVTWQGSEQDKIKFAQGSASVGAALGGCAAGGSAAAAVGSVVPFFGTAAGGVVGCVVGAFGAKTATNYGFAAVQQGGIFNPFEPGNHNVLCGRSEANFAHCAGYIATELGTEGLTYARASKLLKPIDDLKNRSGKNSVNVCAEYYNTELTLFNPDAIGSLSDGGNPLEFDSNAGRCNKYNLPSEGVSTSVQGQSGKYRVKLELKNNDGVKVKLKDDMSSKTRKSFDDAIAESKLKNPKTSKFTYGSYQFDHIIPVHQLINNLVKRGMTIDKAAQAVADATARIAKGSKSTFDEIDVNSPQFTRFIPAELNLKYKVQVDKSFKTLDPTGVRVMDADFLVEVLRDANKKILESGTDDIYQSPYNIVDSNPELK